MKDARLRLAFGGLHPDRTRKLLATYGPERALRSIAAGAIRVSERGRKAIEVPASQRHQELQAAETNIIFRGDDGYPALLEMLPDAPDVLFVRGTIVDRPAVAVVGTRRCTRYGTSLAEGYGRAIAAAGWPLVSGLARGIDGAAHRGTVAGGGIGWAVLGSGIDVMYPREHADLARQLVDCGGAVISESPPGTPPEAWRFPPRNRIISGLAEVVVVVEAGVKGGALITGEAALRHGRQVFAVPGDVGRASSVGCNLLIRDGAFPVLDADDLVDSLELVLGPAPRSQAHPVPEVLPSGGAAGALLTALGSGISDVDELLALLPFGVGEGLALLGRLETEGLIVGDGPGRYVLNPGR